LTEWGEGRGTPVDRWYIERYLHRHAGLISGHVLEVKSDLYASELGAREVEVVDINASNARASVIGDLCDPTTLPTGHYEAAIVTQTLQVVRDPHAAVRNLINSLRPGGVLLITVPCVSRLVDASDRWRWTPLGLQELLTANGPAGMTVDVEGLGNGLAGRAFLFGLAAEDLVPAALLTEDPEYPLVVGGCVRLPHSTSE
jgi:SAM-dependent methyltransferase